MGSWSPRTSCGKRMDRHTATTGLALWTIDPRGWRVQGPPFSTPTGRPAELHKADVGSRRPSRESTNPELKSLRRETDKAVVHGPAHRERPTARLSKQVLRPSRGRDALVHLSHLPCLTYSIHPRQETQTEKKKIAPLHPHQIAKPFESRRVPRYAAPADAAHPAPQWGRPAVQQNRNAHKRPKPTDPICKTYRLRKRRHEQPKRSRQNTHIQT